MASKKLDSFVCPPPELGLGEGAAMPTEFRVTSTDTLAALLDQSLDCIKLIGSDGSVQYMNRNGKCAMEIDNFSAIAGRQWTDLWPEEARPLIKGALEDAGAGIAARFDAFCPTAKGTPRWWDVSVSQVRDNSGELLGYLSVSRDVSDARFAREAAEIAAAEMRHRLKNSYALVGGLLSAFARGDSAREEFVREMRERLSALGIAQTLFVGGDAAPGYVTELVPALVQPFSQPDCPVQVGDLPHISIEQGQADAIALVLGELAVNSSKHGALSQKGEIRISGKLEDTTLTLTWEETSTRSVEARQRTGGQGLRLMQRILAARSGDIHIQWREFGLLATIRLVTA